MYKLHNPKSDIDRLYVKGKGGGKSLLESEVIYKAEILYIKLIVSLCVCVCLFVTYINSYF
jgi:hypothetical protein